MTPKLRREDGGEVADRVKENVHNLPVTSVALAGLLGAGVMALMYNFGPLSRRR